MKETVHSHRSSMKWFRTIIRTVIIVLGLIFAATSETYADPSTDITSSGLNTVVTPPSPGGTVYSITNGTPVGINLFHSFGEFTVGPLDTARFQTTNLAPDISINNILGRVTGGNPSSLFGTIDSAFFYPNANLFLLNPAGIIFGPNATLNVGGSVNFTTADYLRLADDVRFNGIPNLTADALLSTAPVAAFGFLSLAPGITRGAISVQGSSLSVSSGQSITLVGSDVIIGNEAGAAQAANLSAPNGQIRLASANSVGEFMYEHLQAIPNGDGQVFSTYGVITLAPGSLIDVSHGTAGTVSIRGGEFVLDVTDSILTTSAAPPTVPTEDSISLAGGSLVHSSTTSGADGAAIDIITGTLDVKGASQIVSSNEGGLGSFGGDINVTATKSVTVAGYDEAASSGVRTDFAIVTSGVFAGTISDGTVGALTITTPKLTIEDSAEVATLTSGSGNGQAMTLDVGTLEVKTGGRISSISGWNYLLGDFGDGPGQAGMVNILGANSISIVGTGPFNNNYSRIQGVAYGLTGGGSAPIEINASSATVSVENGGRIETLPGFDTEPTGDVTLTINNLNIANGSLNTIGGDGRSGNIRILATGTVSLSGEVIGQPPSINNENGGSGGTGIISIDTGVLALSNRARILNSTFSEMTPSTDAKISIHATDSVTMAGGSDIRVVSFLSDVGSLEILSPTVALLGQASMNTFGFGSGNSGPITINTQHFSLTGGSKLNSFIVFGSAGHGGSITIQGLSSSAESVLIDGTGSGLFSNTRGTGTGGDITVDTNTLTIQNGGTISASTSGTAPSATGGNIDITTGQSVILTNAATISASSTGSGNAGNITVNAGQSLDLRDSSIKMEASQASGGNIDIQAVDRVRLVNSSISTSVLGGAGSGGNITIDPNAVLLQNSQILARAIQGAGGNITIFTPLFLADSSSLVSASSQFGLNGTVTIQSPASNLSGSLGPLSSTPSQAQNLVTQRCAALANSQASSFVVAGREQLPADPGSWLTSPLALAELGESLNTGNAVASAPTVMSMAAQNSGTVSLRRLTPAGFLIANFADSEATGCHS